jgi:hypothetical protein
MDQLRKQAADMALKLLAASDDELLRDPRALDDLEQLATQLLKTVAGLRIGRAYVPGERSGAWRVMQP